MPIFDVTVPLSNRIAVYPGDPPPAIKPAKLIAKGDEANITLLHLGAHTATHVDAPRHFVEGARPISELSLDVLVGDARVIDIPADADAITAAHVTPERIGGATRVLFRTRNSAFWHNEPERFREDFTYLGLDAARELVRQGVRLVGIDYLSIEEMNSKEFPVHRTLLGNDMIIIEGLDLHLIRPGDYELICLPLRLDEGAHDGAPARVILRTPDASYPDAIDEEDA